MDGVHAMVPEGQMSPGARKMRNFYARKADAPLFQQEFGYYCLERWQREGHLPRPVTDQQLAALFGFDPPGKHVLGGLGWCEAAFCPTFEEKWIRDQGPDHEVVQDFAGRQVLYFKGRRQGFMPEYLEHPVKDMASWLEACKWRLAPDTPERYADLEERMRAAQRAAAEGQVICQQVVGGYMYLRSLMGPLELMYLLYDAPELIHDCMRAWFELADAVIARHQQWVTVDELFIAEDICYNHGLLISGEMVRAFLLPYYQQLLENIRRRNLDRSRRVFFQVDTDGFCDPAIEVYGALGLDYLSPFEAASGCDVVRTGREHPELLISGGFDKRVLAAGKDAIDREIDRILPAMRRRGGYIPTCDHGVPEEVSFENYLHYRRRMLQFAQ
ncbi:MAG: uroporphyrinogen decarboxylase family protein [Christensenellales bacterium]|jgi:hypothetical protein